MKRTLKPIALILALILMIPPLGTTAEEILPEAIVEEVELAEEVTACEVYDLELGSSDDVPIEEIVLCETPDESDWATVETDPGAKTAALLPLTQALLPGEAYAVRDLLSIEPDGTDADYASAIWQFEDPDVACLKDAVTLSALTAGETRVIVTLEGGAEVEGTLHVEAAPAAEDEPVEEEPVAEESVEEEPFEEDSQYATGDAVRINITQAAAALADVQGKSYEWTGKPICPDFTLSCNGKTLVKNADYYVRYANNTDPGTAALQVTGVGNFYGSVTATYKILSRPDAYLAPSKLTVGIGESVALSANGTGMTFASSKKNVASVSETGVVTGRKKGTATIRMTTSDGRTFSCAVTVKVKPTRVKLSAAKVTVGVGQKKTLTAKLYPSGCRPGVEWSSSNTDVAMVDGGAVIAIAPGTAVLTAKTYNGKYARCSVTVKPAPETVSLNHTSYDLTVKKSFTLKAAVAPSGAQLSGKFYSSDPTVAKVSSSGKVTGLKAGVAVITAETYNGRTAQCKVQVWPAPTKIVLNAKTANVLAGNTVKLTATVYPSNANPAVKWSTSASSIATVDQNGTVTAVKPGTATITAKTANGCTATCKIYVRTSPTTIKVTAAKTVLYVGEKTTATVTLNANAYSNIEWYSDGSVVSVDSAGRITALKEGVGVVYARPVSAKQLIGSVEIEVRSQQSVKGAIIDISKWQGTIDFDALKPAVSLVICRVSNNLTEDTKFATYAKEMNKRNIPFGVYCYSKASTPEEAAAEAVKMYQIASPYKPKFYTMDAEEATITQSCIEAFVYTLRKLGASKVGAYVAHHRYTSYNITAIKSKLDFVWIPRYGSNTGDIADSTKPAYPCDMWQYTSTGRVPGISGNVDMNVITGTGKSLSWFIS